MAKSESTNWRHKLNNWWANFKDGQMKGAQEVLLREVFNDLYRNRYKIYKVNFIRGIFFGLGSVLGGTIILAIIIWMMSWFVDFPVVGQYLKDLTNAIQQSR